VIPPLVIPPLERRNAAAQLSGEDDDNEVRPPLLRRDVAEQSYPAPPHVLRRRFAARDLTSQLLESNSGLQGSYSWGEETLQEGDAILQRWESRMGDRRSRDAFYGEPPRSDNRERRNAVDLTSERHRSSLSGLRQITARAVPSLLSMLPSRQLTPRFVNELSVESCAICCDVYKADEDVACLPCHGFHMAHTHCLRRWLEQKPECPMCRWTTDDTSPQVLESRIATAWTHLRRTD